MEKFMDELMELLNKHSWDTKTDIPDFILAGFLEDILIALVRRIEERDNWYNTHKHFYGEVNDTEA